jgi:dTDP-4-amino-4,6-dideoxygalactose transaminase
MVVTASTALAEACRSLCDYGRETLLEGRETLLEGREALLEGREPSAGGGAVQAHVRPGFNYRLTEIQAVVGLHELARLESWNLPRRRGFAKIYDHAFSNLYGVRALPYTSAERVNAYWKYPLQLEPDKLACGIGEFREALAAEGIPEWGAFLRESYEEPVFASRAGPGGAVPRCPTAEALRDRTVVLGLHPTWEKSHVETCVAGVKKVLRAFRR